MERATFTGTRRDATLSPVPCALSATDMPTHSPFLRLDAEDVALMDEMGAVGDPRVPQLSEGAPA